MDYCLALPDYLPCRYWLNMRYLAILCIILSSTLFFTNAAKCGIQVKKHNCDCKDKNAGLLNLDDDGKLLVCDGAGWKALKYEIPLGSQTNPGFSCKNIKDNRDDTADGVY